MLATCSKKEPVSNKSDINAIIKPRVSLCLPATLKATLSYSRGRKYYDHLLNNARSRTKSLQSRIRTGIFGEFKRLILC